MFNEINTNLTLKHYGFPSIGQFANVVYNVNHKAHYVGQDENNEPIYDSLRQMPVLKFIGTTKMHGTNAGIIVDFHNEIVYLQSRENIITPTKDNAGFASFAAGNQKEILDMVMSNIDINSVDWKDNVIGVYGEWCGGNIQKGVALCELSKMFVIFAVAVIQRETPFKKSWLSIDKISKFKVDGKIHNIYNFPTYEIEINFAKHHESTNKLVEMTIAVEDMCPVGKAFGVEGIGEGIVFICISDFYDDSGFWFKSKGEKHSKSKVKQIRPVDNDKVTLLFDIAEKVTPSWRMEQIFNLTFDTINGGKPDRTKMGEYIRAVVADITKEELTTITEAGLSVKDLGGNLAKISKDYYLLMEKEFLNTIS